MLNKNDINILIQAMDAWTGRRFAGDMMGEMIAISLAKDEEQRKEMKKKLEEQKNKRKEEVEREKEDAIIIKAKLIEMKKELDLGFEDKK